ncbi:MAG TPA: aldo/keto reductase [Pseudonocardiaceae bacterium]
MRTLRLGRDGPEVSALGLGCMRMSAPAAMGHEDESVATIQAALDAGINFLDTGDFYAAGHNEMLIGRALRGRRREDAVISVKFGFRRDPSGAFLGLDTTPNSVKNFVTYSLRRLGVDEIDIYQPGRIDPSIPVEDTVGAIAELIEQGKVRHLGVSEVNAEQLRKANAVHPVTALEIEYSLVTRLIEAEILPTARELGIGIVAYGVIAAGLLSGQLTAPLPAGDLRALFPRFQGDNLTHNLRTAAALTDMAARKNCTPTQLAVAWVVSRGPDICTLVGMSRRSRLPENLAALQVSLSDEEARELDAAFAVGSIAGDRYPPGLAELVPN